MLVDPQPGDARSGRRQRGRGARCAWRGSVHRTDHDGQVRLAAVGDRRAVDWGRSAWPGVDSVEPAPGALQAGEPRVPSARHGDPGRAAARSAAASSRSWRPVLGRGRGAGLHHRRGRRKAGATVLRGGAFKPRTSPYAFQGLGEEGLRILRRAADAHGLAVVTEVMDAQAGRAGRALRRHPADRRAQHAELLAAARGRAGRRSRCCSSAAWRDHRGVAAGGRVRAGAGQRAGHPVRARHPHVRDLHAQHARPERHPGGARSSRTCR